MCILGCMIVFSILSPSWPKASIAGIVSVAFALLTMAHSGELYVERLPEGMQAFFAIGKDSFVDGIVLMDSIAEAKAQDGTRINGCGRIAQYILDELGMSAFVCMVPGAVLSHLHLVFRAIVDYMETSNPSYPLEKCWVIVSCNGNFAYELAWAECQKPLNIALAGKRGVGMPTISPAGQTLVSMEVSSRMTSPVSALVLF